jgi:hypothetical protein
MPAKDQISDNSDRTIESFSANAAFAASGSKYLDTTDATTYDFQGIQVLTDAVIADVSGFDSIHEGWANSDSMLQAVGYYPISGSSITLTSGTVLLIAK